MLCLIITFDIIDWTLIANEKDCKGSEVYVGRFSNATGCASECKNISSMFIFGFGPKCNYKGCKCWCKYDALANGTCSTIGIRHYDLYRVFFPEPGNCNSYRIMLLEVQSNIVFFKESFTS